jgi:cleavage and polyadenylation specificity factor subunit 1
LQHIPLELGSPIVHVTSVDPYISLLTTDGQVITLMLRETRGVAKLVISKSTLSNVHYSSPLCKKKNEMLFLQSPPVTTICMYRDISGLFTYKIPEDFTHVPEHFVHESEAKMEVENEDDLLYGDDSDFKMPTLNPPPPKPKIYYNWWKKYLIDARPSYWLFVVRDNSNLEIYSIPDFKLCYYITNLCFGHKVLVDSLESVTLSSSSAASAAHEANIQRQYEVKEILVVALGNHSSRPLLMVRLDNDLYIYEVFRFPRGNLKMRFRKLKHSLIYSPNVAGKIDTEDSDFFAIQERIIKMRYFNNIAGNYCVVCFLQPNSMYFLI